MIDVSDEATGLPPLREVHPEDAILALEWVVGNRGSATMTDDTELDVYYLSFRGLILDEEGNPQYGQIHVAMPSEAMPTLVEQLILAATVKSDTPE